MFLRTAADQLNCLQRRGVNGYNAGQLVYPQPDENVNGQRCVANQPARALKLEGLWKNSQSKAAGKHALGLTDM